LKVTVEEGFPEVEVVIRCPSESGETERIASALCGLDARLSGTLDGQTCLIDPHDVLYFESVDKRCFIYTATEAYETGRRLFEIADQLSQAGFFRSAKSQIVNIAKITSLRPDFDGRLELVMEDGEKLIVSRKYARGLKERLGLK